VLFGLVSFIYIFVVKKDRIAANVQIFSGKSSVLGTLSTGNLEIGGKVQTA
jgi:hypothetical protein